MGGLDILLIFTAVLVVGFCVQQRFVKALVLLIAVYLATLTAALLYRPAAAVMAAMTKGIRFEGFLFLFLFFLFVLIFYLIARVAYPDTTLPKLHFVDFVLGGLVGIVVAALIVTVITGAVGYMVSECWEPYASYSSLYALYTGSQLRPEVQMVRSYYLYSFYPFFAGSGYPAMLSPP